MKKVNSAAIQMELIKYLTPKVRSIVTDDFDESLNYLSQYIDLNIEEVPSGTECWTWPIPQKWSLKHAKVKFKDEVILDGNEHALTVAPYSQSFSGSVTREELIKHLRWSDKYPDAFVYEFRYAYNYQMKDWCLSMPLNRVNNLEEGKYEVDISTVLEDGSLKIGESFLQGKNPETIVIISHLCHPGQSNDGVAGVVSALRLFQSLTERSSLKYSYLFLALPETIGSVAYLWKNFEKLNQFKFGICVEMPGVDNPLCLKESHIANSKIDKVARSVFKRRLPDKHKISSFWDAYGNDELVFSDPDINVPMIGVQHHDFPEYHTSRDSIDTIIPERLDETHHIMEEIIDIMEKDYIPVKLFKGPLYLSRFNLYVDIFENFNLHVQIRKIMNKFDSSSSVFEIAEELGLDFYELYDYLELWINAGLLEKRLTT